MDAGIIVSVTGYRGTGRTTLYALIEQCARKRFPDVPFAFLGSPLRGLVHPLLWHRRERKKHATTRLLNCWARLDDARCKSLQPALARGAVVVTDGFGLDAFLYATARAEADETEEAERLHHGLVDLRLKQWDIRPPQYILVRSDDHKKIDEAMLRTHPKLKDIDQRERWSFIQKQERRINRYFDPAHGQNPPHFVDVGLPPEAMCDQALKAIERVLTPVVAQNAA